MIVEGIPLGLEKKISRLMSNITIEFKLIEPNDKILIGMSGGKDSLLMLHFLDKMRSAAPFPFEIGVFHLNGSMPDYPGKPMMERIQSEGFPILVDHIDMPSIFEKKIEPDHSPCPLCARLRRGILYTQAYEHGYTKIALGHHRDDAVETLLMNILYNGIIKSMPPKLISDDGRNTVIRPMLGVPEALLIEASQYLTIPILKQSFCHMDQKGKRYETKQLLKSLSEQNDKILGNMFHAIQHVVPSHLLDKNLHKD